MKKTRKTVCAVLLILLLIGSWVISFTGIPGKFGSLDKQLKYGLDINGGVYVLLEADTDAKGTELTQIMNQTKSVLENRVNAMGISEAQVSIEGNDRIRVEMPGVENAEEAIEQIGRTAQLQFFLPDGTLALTGEGISDSQIATDSNNGGYKITIDFTKDGSEKFADATEKAVAGVESKMTDETGNPVSTNAIVIALDDEIISAPTVNEKINSRSCEITRPGGFSEAEASSLSALIRGGALPTNLTEINSSVQTATIGANALELAVKAGAIGLALVMLIMVICYGALGIIADIALALYIQFVLWIMAAMGSVLTLPGIAGIILSIGMAVDSNVIIFTRIREEIMKGKSIQTAVDAGYHAALSTVVDSQTTTLVAAFVLYIFGTTSVKGFALTLMIGTVMSVITAVFITQLFVGLLAESRFGTNSMFGMKEDGSEPKRMRTKFSADFIGNRKKFYAISACVIIIGMGFALFRGFNYGIDFTGGTMMQIEMGQEVDIKEVKETIAEYGLDPAIVYASDNHSQIIIRTIKDLKSSERGEVVDTLQKKYGFEDKDVLASEEFGPTVGKDLRRNAFKSIIIAAIAMLVYIRFRFKNWRYGLAAVTGLVHDILVTLAVYAMFHITINNPFIAGILTVVGYSINDTIVVFDRIRENSKFFKRKQNTELINTSINQTVSRSLMTSATTLVVMIPLFFMAGTELKAFLIPLMIGVLTGTYSSIFICSGVYYDLSRKGSMSKYEIQREKFEAEKKRNDGVML